MPLAPGTRLGSYEIVAPIGAGGMGEVYRARDAKLNRDVAIKVLPDQLGANPDALSRFEREAQAVAALSHPNILAIHDFGTASIPVDGTTTTRAYAVTELLDGETLRAKLENGALPTRKAVDYALQIVHGIAAAHQKGVVHRDLKPENIYVTSDGRVKILDFGLAKVAGPAAESSLMQTQSGTSPGTVMGTVGYMSPEQVRGLPVDHRTDIFSFGVVLYEMLSGRRAFRGDSNVETMNAILKEDPPELAVTGSHVPPALDRIVRRCIEKNANERFHSAHDLGLAVETLSATGSSTSGPVIAAPSAKARLAPWMLGAAAVVLVAAAYFAGQRVAGPSAVETPQYQTLTYRRGMIWSARYAGDGRTVVYSATWGDEPRRLYSTRVGSPDSLALPYADADVASISSTGELAIIQNRRILRAWARPGTLARASLNGGAARAVLENVQDADWLPDGSGFAAARSVDTRYTLEFPVGKTVYETNGYISDVRVSPDGTLAAFVDHPLVGDDRGSIAVVDRSGKQRKLSTDYSSVQGLAWSHDGKEVWFTASDQGTARALFAATVDGMVRLVLRVPGSLHLGDMGADGSVLLSQVDARTEIHGRIPGDVVERDLSWFDWSTVPRLSADGKTLLFTEEGDGGGPDYSVFIRPTDGGPAVRLGAGLGVDISPDGRWVLAVRLNPEPAQLMLLPTGAGEAKVLTDDELSHNFAWFVGDGSTIVFDGFAPGRPRRMYLQNVAGGVAKPVTPEGVTGPVSRDGKAVAFERKIYPTDGSPPRPIPGLEPADRIVAWGADSGTLFLRQLFPSGDYVVFRLDTATGRRTLLHKVPRVSGVQPGPWFTIALDGSTYMTTYLELRAELFRVTGLR